MKIFGKAKASLKSNSKEPGTGLPELVMLITKVVERLEILEKKTDLVISQTSGGLSKGRGHSSQSFPKSHSLGHLNESKSLVQERPHGHAQERRKRVLYKAICAECHKDCEIPFQPAGERPVYCKECFAKRKADRSLKTDDRNEQVPLSKGPGLPNSSQRQVSVTKKGVGKVTVSEIVQTSLHAASQKKKDSAPEKKSKR